MDLPYYAEGAVLAGFISPVAAALAAPAVS
jgi:hypothetical protein